MITAGVDIGAKYVKIVLLKDKVLHRAKDVVGFDVCKSATTLFEDVLNKTGLSRVNVEKVGATGMGKNEIYHKPPIDASSTISEVFADAAGALYLLPSVRTVIDVGAEEGRGIRLGENGKVKDFVINERCAAGAGTFVETMARALEVGVDDMGPLSLKSTKAIPMNAQCAVFAESEVVSLIHSRVTKEDIARAIHDAMAGRIASMVLRVGVEEDVLLVGGVALNSGFLPSLKKELNTEIIVPEFPEYAGALGAALIAKTMDE
ncbi:CoA activase [Candidatus Bathyarchaeota archaeon]|nr:MAG: CoA activase [Candidatus Bathyarchaeota archaeon]